MEQALTFGQALDVLEKGELVARKGWNGQNMYLFKFDKSYANFPETLRDGNEVETSYCIKTAQNTVVLGWKPSQTDMAANDWFLVHIESTINP